MCCTTNFSSALRSQASENHCTAMDRRTRELPKYRESVFLLASPLFSVRNVSHGVVKTSSPLTPQPSALSRPSHVCQQEHNVWLLTGRVRGAPWLVQQPHCDCDMALGSTFVGTEASTDFGARFKKKNTKLGTKANSYLE